MATDQADDPILYKPPTEQSGHSPRGIGTQTLIAVGGSASPPNQRRPAYLQLRQTLSDTSLHPVGIGGVLSETTGVEKSEDAFVFEHSQYMHCGHPISHRYMPKTQLYMS